MRKSIRKYMCDSLKSTHLFEFSLLRSRKQIFTKLKVTGVYKMLPHFHTNPFNYKSTLF